MAHTQGRQSPPVIVAEQPHPPTPPVPPRRGPSLSPFRVAVAAIWPKQVPTHSFLSLRAGVARAGSGAEPPLSDCQAMMIYRSHSHQPPFSSPRRLPDQPLAPLNIYLLGRPEAEAWVGEGLGSAAADQEAGRPWRREASTRVFWSRYGEPAVD